MEWMKNMGLKKSFVLLSAVSVVISLLVIGAVFIICGTITDQYPSGGMSITSDGIVRELEGPTWEQARVINILGWVEVFACILVPVGCLGIASLMFYQLKLKKPIAVLRMGTERIREHDLTFSIPEISGDELGQVCAAFETMRAEMVRTNQELWRQAEERKRLNAVFSHDLRNPVTVLKGTVKLLQQGTADESALERLETYVLRLERYVEAMSSIQRLEQMPVQKKEVRLSMLRDEVEETARLLAPGVRTEVCADDRYLHSSVILDHGLFLTVAENLIGNAARYAHSRVNIQFSVRTDTQYFDSEIDEKRNMADELGGMKTGMKKQMFIVMTVSDDGSGYPAKLIQDGPKPFGKMEEDAAHFGMGLYICQMLCMKHGGTLRLENDRNGGARVTAFF